MRRFAWARWLTASALVALGGCANSSMVMKGNLDKLQQQQLAMSRQNQELQSRAAALDGDNQELEKLLAQSRQANKVLEDQLAVVRQQLGGVTSQLARLREDKEASEEEARTLTASLRRQRGVSIPANNSLLQTLPAIHLPGVHVRQDGEVIRVELPGGRLFDPGTARLRQDAVPLIVDAVNEVLRTYRDQIIGVEGHTESGPIQSTQWRNNVQLSAGRAMAVHEVLLTRARLDAGQMFVVGHGASHPVVSNATPAGKQRNSRVELVVYPERRRQ